MSYITTYTRNHFNPVHPEAEKIDIQAVSYTHLTLPTKLEV